MQLFENNASTTVAANLTAGATSLTLADGSGFPTPTGGDTFRLTLQRLSDFAIEVVEVTARAGNVVTIVRAQEGTSALTFNVGDLAEMRLTKETLEALRDHVHIFDYLDLVPQPAPAHQEGRMAYDSDNKGFIGYIDDPEVTLNIGEELWVRARNNTGSTILNGTVVYISGALGQKPTIGLAQADARATSEVVGLATHDIENNTDGMVTVYGLVRDLNLSAYSDGDPLYLSDSVAGGLTDVRPTADGSYRVLIGHVLNNHPTQGVMLVQAGRPRDLSDLANLVADGVVFNDVATEFTKQQNFPSQSLVDGANIAWNVEDAQVAKVTINGARTLDNPTNVVDGGTYVLAVIQGAGGDTLAYGANYDFGDDGAPTLSTTVGKMDFMQFIGGASGKMHFVGINKGHTP